MKRLDFNRKYSSPVCLALGFFDSLHCGHRELIRRMKAHSDKCGAESCVFTFDNDMGVFFDRASTQIYTFEERAEILDKLGVDIVLHRSFDAEFMNTSAENFLSELFSTLKIVKVFCGYDYSFGRERKGTPELLKSVCAERGIETEILPKIEAGGERVSTTRIKELICRGEIEEADKLLEEPFWTRGTVVHGRNVGHLYGIPTANIEYPHGKILPKYGVYGTIVYVGNESYKGVTNIGAKPTFGEMSVSVETLIDGLKSDLYGKEIKIEFVKFLRNIKKFDSPAALSAQIHRDMNWRH